MAAAASASSSSSQLLLTNNDERFLENHHDSRPRARRQRGLLVAIPDDETRQSYAPLCDDGRHIDIRKLQQCNAGSCYNEYIGQCTFECIWTDVVAPVRRTTTPTRKPTMAMSQTDNHVLLRLQELAEQYRLSENIRASIIKFLKALIQEKLGYDLEIDLEILEMEWPGRLPGEPHSLPIEITAMGPADVSQFSTSYILKTIRENKGELVSYLKKLDGGDPFKNVGLVVETYDLNDIVLGPTDPPSRSPTKAREPVEVMDAVIMEDVEAESGIPWWVWLIVGLAVLIMCCCGIWCCMSNNRQDEKQEKDVNIYNVQNGGDTSYGRSTATGMKSHRTRKSSRGNDDASRMPSRTHKSSRGNDDASRMTSGTRKTSRTARARTMVSNSFTAHKRRPDPEEQDRYNRRKSSVDPGQRESVDAPTTMAAVSVIPENEGFDPPEEDNALVLYVPGEEQNKISRDPTMYIPDEKQNKTSRDPTMYIPAGEEQSEEPDGMKITRKTSVFAAEAIHNDRSDRNSRSKKRSSASRRVGNRLKSSVTWKKRMGDIDMENAGDDPSEYTPNQNRKDPDTDEVEHKRKSSKKKKSSRSNGASSKRRSSAASQRSKGAFGDRLKSSFAWKRDPVDLELGDIDNDSCETPSMMTNPNGMEEQKDYSAPYAPSIASKKKERRSSREEADGRSRDDHNLRRSSIEEANGIEEIDL
eukprot:CAMPEP_0172319030 /NCGR_PEP_ID=MMETSP1058-20130122/36577_1 /TAXON_ID=83371 /ORGANISM="Detonula confervacea, Strain CCMP 353" /LENGTH=698 /DNA_ID=CAMNT_0013033973 /DNA_START=1 /DNA_END=2097 /DNA_ORIENTATION=-